MHPCARLPRIDEMCLVVNGNPSSVKSLNNGPNSLSSAEVDTTWHGFLHAPWVRIPSDMAQRGLVCPGGTTLSRRAVRISPTTYRHFTLVTERRSECTSVSRGCCGAIWGRQVQVQQPPTARTPTPTPTPLALCLHSASNILLKHQA